MLEKLHTDLTHSLHSASKPCKLPNKHVSENGGFKVF